MWKLSNESADKRTYTNSTTGSKCITEKVYTDKEGNNWWQFQDLMTIPYTRNFAATKISSLYTLGISKEDATNFFTKHKATLKSDDKGEKYEIAYAETLDFESKFNSATDAVKQMSSLVCVYFLLGDELIDSFDNALQIRKMAILEADPECHAFFLQRQMSATEHYIERLKLLSTIVSLPQNGK